MVTFFYVNMFVIQSDLRDKRGDLKGKVKGQSGNNIF